MIFESSIQLAPYHHEGDSHTHEGDSSAHEADSSTYGVMELIQVHMKLTLENIKLT